MNLRHDTALIAALLAALSLTAPPVGSKEPAAVTLLFTSDEYGYLEPCG